LLETGIAAGQLGARELVLQVARQRVGIIADQDRADAELGCGDQNGAERTLADGEPYGGIDAAGAIARRRHAQDVVRLRIKATVGVVAGAVDRLGHRAAAVELGTHFPGALRRGVRLGRQAGRGFEQTMQVIDAQTRLGRQHLEARRLVGAFDHAAQSGYRRGVLLGARRLVGPAAPAGPKPGALGIGRVVVKGNVFGPGAARGARRTAVHAGRGNRVDKPISGYGVARQHRRPARVGHRRCGASRGFRSRLHVASFQLIGVDG